ncbi:NADH:ubiquinone reductase (Na(+)-transporting) subunit C [Candidatus Riflebacteria bacterium]
MRNNLYIIFFTIVICAVASSLLALASKALKPNQEANELVDRQSNILRAAALLEAGKSYKNQEIIDIFKAKIKEQKTKKDKTIYLSLAKGGEGIEAYIIPVSGKGLWSTLYGYLALEPDLVTIKGLTFYQHGETPGLGAEIEKAWFLKNFEGKKILDEKGNVCSVEVLKGKVKDIIKEEKKKAYYVDGISGATFTGVGVNKLLKKGILDYESYFKTKRGK